MINNEGHGTPKNERLFGHMCTLLPTSNNIAWA